MFNSGENGQRPRVSRRGPPQDNGPTFQESMQEAQTRSLDFPATERAVYVRAMVKRVTEFKKEGKTVDEIKERLPEFVRDYPHLFEMLTQEEGYDSANLQGMLAMLDRMGQGGLDPHQATVLVGKQLASKYIKPSNQAGQSS